MTWRVDVNADVTDTNSTLCAVTYSWVVIESLDCKTIHFHVYTIEMGCQMSVAWTRFTLISFYTHQRLSVIVHTDDRCSSFGYMRGWNLFCLFSCTLRYNMAYDMLGLAQLSWGQDLTHVNRCWAALTVYFEHWRLTILTIALCCLLAVAASHTVRPHGKCRRLRRTGA